MALNAAKHGEVVYDGPGELVSAFSTTEALLIFLFPPESA
jgi:hypothetical protein